MILRDCLGRWAAALADSSASPRLDAEILFKYASGWTEVQLLLRDRERLEPSLVERANALIEKRMRGTPIAYIVGEKAFYTLSLKITPAVLIPRPETELLGVKALAFIAAKPDARVLDLGTGSGAIALAIAGNAPETRVIATDISAASLELARRNAGIHGLTNVRFLQSDWFGALGDQRFDLIVANPPYIDADDPHLQHGDLRFEPRQALVAGDRGLADIQQIVKGASRHLLSGGLLALEHGFDQGSTIRELLTRTGLEHVHTLRDLGQLERVSCGSL